MHRIQRLDTIQTPQQQPPTCGACVAHDDLARLCPHTLALPLPPEDLARYCLSRPCFHHHSQSHQERPAPHHPPRHCSIPLRSHRGTFHDGHRRHPAHPVQYSRHFRIALLLHPCPHLPGSRTPSRARGHQIEHLLRKRKASVALHPPMSLRGQQEKLQKEIDGVSHHFLLLECRWSVVV